MALLASLAFSVVSGLVLRRALQRSRRGRSRDAEREFRSTMSALAPRHKLWSTPVAAIQAAFDLLGVSSEDKVLDIGCGDGRSLIEAARRHGCRAVGYEINTARAEEARQKIESAGLSGRATVVTGNAMEVIDSVLADDVTVVFLYLTEQGLAKVLPYLRRNPTTLRVSSYIYQFRGLTEIERRARKKTWVRTRPNNPDVQFPVFTYSIGGNAPGDN